MRKKENLKKIKYNSGYMQWKMMGKQSRGGKMPENRKLFFTCVEIFSLFFYYFKFILISIHDY